MQKPRLSRDNIARYIGNCLQSRLLDALYLRLLISNLFEKHLRITSILQPKKKKIEVRRSFDSIWTFGNKDFAEGTHSLWWQTINLLKFFFVKDMLISAFTACKLTSQFIHFYILVVLTFSLKSETFQAFWLGTGSRLKPKWIPSKRFKSCNK